jgi:hypothetical protein
MCEDNCVLLINAAVQGNNVITLQDNDDSAITATFGGNNEQVAADWDTAGNNLQGLFPVTLTELGPNTGVFGTYDEGDISNIIVTNAALRGTSASIDYNESPTTVLIGFDFASIDIQPIDDEWSSGEEIPGILIDGDANKNSRVDEDLDLFNPNNALIPALSTGAPFTLQGTDTFIYYVDSDNGNTAAIADTANSFTAGTATTLTNANAALPQFAVQAFSQRAILNVNGNAGGIDLDSTGAAGGAATLGSGLMIGFTGRTLGDLQNVVRYPVADGGTVANSGAAFEGFNFFNYDIRTFNQNQDPLGHAIIQTDIFLVIGDAPANTITTANLAAVGSYCFTTKLSYFI